VTSLVSCRVDASDSTAYTKTSRGVRERKDLDLSLDNWSSACLPPSRASDQEEREDTDVDLVFIGQDVKKA
jgi:hypothetical protein